MLRRKLLLAIPIVLALSATRVVAASTITLHITGVVDDVLDGAKLLSPPLSAGMPFTALVTYDVGVADLYADNPNQGRFDFAPGGASILIDVNGTVFGSSLDVPPEVLTWNDMPIDPHFEHPPPPGDAIYMGWSGMSGPAVLDRLFTDFRLADHTASVFSGDQLPTAIDLASFDVRELNVLGFRDLPRGNSQMMYLRLQMQTIAVVPEPSSMSLVGAILGTLGTVALRGRWKRFRSRKRERANHG